jgi:hypothetical protein
MTKIKTSELTGPALDWAVVYVRCLEANEGRVIQARDLANIALANGPELDFEALIERERTAVYFMEGHGWRGEKYITERREHHQQTGSTPREAAFRCFVASKLGDEVDVPEELA